MKIALIGRSQLLYRTALLLAEKGHDIRAVITAKAAPEYTRKEEDFRELAARLGARFFLTNSLDGTGIDEACRGVDIGISVNWTTVIRDEHIRKFRLGILNAHHGDLPRYRGNACSNWAIIRGEDRIATSVHFMEGGELDCGRIVAQGEFLLDDESTITDVYEWSENAIPDLFCSALERLESDESWTLKTADPEADEAFRCYPRLPEDGFIEWDSPVKDVHNLVRAVCYPFVGAYTYHLAQGNLKKLIILKSRIVRQSTKDLAVPGHVLKNDPESGESWVRCRDGILALLLCRYEGEAESFLPGRFFKSIRLRLGVRAEDWIYAMTSRGDHGKA